MVNSSEPIATVISSVPVWQTGFARPWLHGLGRVFFWQPMHGAPANTAAPSCRCGGAQV
ncbi:MAG: hypothetical protein RL375_4835 [Pseudomonadota bacterium]